MSLLYADAKKILARYVGTGGTCPDSDKLDLFCRKVFQTLLWSGTYGSVRKYCFNAIAGCITLPYELEIPLKVKIEGRIGTVWNKWYEFYNVHDLEGCLPAPNALREEPNYFCTVYNLPNKFCRVGVVGTTDEKDDAHVIISGKDPSGREVITNHKGVQITGEYIQIRKNQLSYSQVVFGEITAVQKSITNGYVQLYWYRPEINLRGFLSEYSPFEENPEYRRFKLTSPCEPCLKISILGRIRLKERYADTERIPFDNIMALELAGQAANSSFNNDEQMAAAKETHMVASLNKEATYKTPQPGTPVEMYAPLSGCAVKNIVD